MKVRVFCNAGMSTSLLVTRMRQYAEEIGVEADIDAFSASEAKQQMAEADVALIGPQISCRKQEFKALGERFDVPVEVISSADYGAVNGRQVLELALCLASK